MAESIALPPIPRQTILPSYLYWQYNDDADLQAFVDTYNQFAQSYLAWFNNTPIAVYTSPNVTDQLLDWIAAGIYGLDRPVFSSHFVRIIAGVNSAPMNTIPVNGATYLRNDRADSASNDYFKRVMTWWLYAGDGRHFSIPWLRKRVARFLYGVNGTDITLTQTETVHIAAGTIPAPPAPVLSYVAGGSIHSIQGALNSFPVNALPLNGIHSIGVTYYARNTYVNGIGETLAGPESSLYVPPGNLLVVATPPAANGIPYWRPYVGVQPTRSFLRAGLNSAAVNSQPVNGTTRSNFYFETSQSSLPIDLGTGWTEPTSGLVEGAPLPSSNTANTEGNLIITVPAGTSSEVFKQAFDQLFLSFPFQLSAKVVIS